MGVRLRCIHPFQAHSFKMEIHSFAHIALDSLARPASGYATGQIR